MNKPIIAARRTNNITYAVRDVLLIADQVAKDW